MHQYWKTCLGSLVSAAVVLVGTLGAVSGAEPLWDLPLPSVLAPTTATAPISTAMLPLQDDTTAPDATDQWQGNTCGSTIACAPQRWWFTADYLLQWTNGDAVPPLLTTNAGVPPRGDAGVLGVGDTQVIIGGRLDEGGRSGVALGGGYWLDDAQCSSVQATWWYAGDPADELNDVWSSSGVPVLARPFFNVGSGMEDSQLVAYPNVVAGAIRIATGSDLRSVETLLSMNLRRGCRGRIDVLGGYRYFRFREGVFVEENLVSTDPGGGVQIGTKIDLFDQFDTSNSFHGGTIGLLTSFTRGCWQFDVATKLAVGNVRQQLFINGGTVVTTPNGNQAVSSGGFLALPSNMGTYTDDAFGLLPELNLKARLAVTEHLSLNLGYNLLFLTNVYRAGQQIDRSIDPGQLPGGMAINGNIPNALIHPAAAMSTSTLRVQGLNVGCTLTY